MIAQADTLPAFNVQLTYDNASHGLTAVISEVQTSQNACDLVLTKFEYMGDVKLMNLELAEDFCPMDIVGNRKATVSWQVPRTLRQGGEFYLRVNGKVLGTVTIDNSTNGAAKPATIRIRK